MITDAHHHLWNYSPDAYPWIGDGMDVLKNNFLPADLHAVTTPAEVTKTVAVQARQNLGETRWLLDLAATDPVISGVVGWLPLTHPQKLAAALAELASNPLLKGVRHVVQDEPDDAFILGDDFNHGVAQLHGHGLVYDILIYSRHLPNTTTFIDRHPGQAFVLDHIAKPVITASGRDDAWFTGIRELAKRPNLTCKLSGVVTEVRDPGCPPELVHPYLDAALDAFGPSRLMLGTDWPVCLLKTTYAEWVDTVLTLVSTLSPDEQAQILHNTADQTYRLGI
ncbi:MAG: amidohydrolase family protein [Verrucomicrobiales bacterium]|nr:amidohydrolase family protein [Verrucomicrobiales bacterium]